MKLSKFFSFFLPSDDDEMLISQVSENFENVDKLINDLQNDKATKNSPDFTGKPTAPTAAKGTSTTQVATTAFVQAVADELQKKIDAIKVFVGNSRLGDVIEFLNMEIYRIQHGGHSEYEYFKIRCVGCKLKTGDYVDNKNSEYVQCGDRTYGTQNRHFIGFNPDLLIALPVTTITLDNCFYVGAENSAYKTISLYDITEWEDCRQEGDSYAVYSVATVKIYNT